MANGRGDARMPPEKADEAVPVSPQAPGRPSTRSSPRDYHYLTIPAPIRRLFNRFPLITYPPNALPSTRVSSSLPRDTSNPILHIFSTSDDARHSRPSFNPASLRWQTILRFADVAVDLVPSNNHASPAATLPFLLPPSQQTSSSSHKPSYLDRPISTTSALLEFISTASRPSSPIPDISIAQEPYLALLQSHIRNAYLHSLYLCPDNQQLLETFYIDPCTSSPLVRAALSHQLRAKARQQLLKGLEEMGVEWDTDVIYECADEAFEALDAFLAMEEWFGGEMQSGEDSGGGEEERSRPGVLDAHVFSYTYVIAISDLAWQDTRLRDLLQGRENLVSHSRRIARKYYRVQPT